VSVPRPGRSAHGDVQSPLSACGDHDHLGDIECGVVGIERVVRCVAVGFRVRNGIRIHVDAERQRNSHRVAERIAFAQWHAVPHPLPDATRPL